MPLLVVAALARTDRVLVAVLIAAPDAPTLPVVAVKDIDVPVTVPAPDMEVSA